MCGVRNCQGISKRNEVSKRSPRIYTMKMEGDLFSETSVNTQQNATGEIPEGSATFSGIEKKNIYFPLRSIIDVGNYLLTQEPLEILHTK